MSETGSHDDRIGGPGGIAGTGICSPAHPSARVIGKRLLIVPVPVLTPRLSSYWLNLVTAVVGPVSVARPLCPDRRPET